MKSGSLKAVVKEYGLKAVIDEVRPNVLLYNIIEMIDILEELQEIEKKLDRKKRTLAKSK